MSVRVDPSPTTAVADMYQEAELSKTHQSDIWNNTTSEQGNFVTSDAVIYV